MAVIKYIILFLIASLFSIFTFAKPTKIFYPQVTGVECVEQWLCIDDKDKLDEAIQLYENAFQNIEKKLRRKKKEKVNFSKKSSCKVLTSDTDIHSGKTS